MSKLSFALGVLVLPLALISIQAQPSPRTGTATVSGIVTLKGEPAPGVSVWLEPMPGFPGGRSNSGMTDENGRFRITQVDAGRYRISAHAPGYISKEDEWSGSGGRSLDVAEGGKVENIALEIKRGGAIAGRITDSRGRPAPEEPVYLHKLDKDGKTRDCCFSSAYLGGGRTDDRGFYRIYGLPEGRYLVNVGNVRAPVNLPFNPRAFYPNVRRESEAKAIEVTEGSEATGIDITLPDPKQSCSISGRVVDAVTGRPVAGVEVFASSLSEEGKPTGALVESGLRTYPNGEFYLNGMLPDKYALLVRPDPEFNDDGSGFIGEPVILDIEDDVEGAEIKVRQAASISGVAVIEGTKDPKILSRLSLVRLDVSFAPRNWDPLAPVGRNPYKYYGDGRFRIRGLQAGRVDLSLNESPSRYGLAIDRIEYNGAVARNGIEVGAGQQARGVRVVFVYSALALRGELKVVGGALPAGFRFHVMARRKDQAPETRLDAVFDAPGEFVIENVPPGEYVVNIYPFHAQSPQFDPQTLRLIPPLTEKTVVVSDNARPVVFELDMSRKEGNR